MRFLFLLIFSANFSAAQELDFPVLEDFFYVGANFETEIDTKVDIVGIQAIGKHRQKSKPAFGFDIGVNAHKNWGVSFLLDFAQFKSDDPEPADNALFLGVGPRFRVPTNRHPNLIFWGAFGIGTVNYQYGTTKQTDYKNGVLYQFHDSTTWGFAISPRVGADYRITENLAFRIQVSYTETKITEGFTAKNYPAGTTIGSGTFELKPQWYTGSIGIQARF